MFSKRTKIFYRLFFITVVILSITLITSFYLVQDSIKKLSINQSTDILTSHNRYLNKMDLFRYKERLVEYADNHSIRITYVSLDGAVLFDSKNNPEEMDNHQNRPEILQAIETGKGKSMRYSNTMGKYMLYLAWKSKNYVLRTSIALKDINSSVQVLVRKLLILHIILLGLAVWVIYKTTRAITVPLEKLTDSITKFGKTKEIDKLRFTNNDEVGVLTNAFNKMSKQIVEDMGELKYLENLRKEFIANASHELKTPITTIQGFVETLENGAIEDSKYSRKFLKTIKKNVDRLKRLVEDMLSLSAIENTQVSINEVDILRVFYSLIDDMSLRDKVKIKSKEAKIYIRANEDDIYLAMQNYIDNALKYCPEAEIEIILKRLNGNFYFAVKDNGSGIEEKYQKRLFERFYRPDKDRSSKHGGTGLGLSIVKNIVKKYGGNVGLESKESQGSIFYFTVPLIES